MKKLLTHTLFLLTLSASAASAQVIISDDFSNALVPTNTKFSGNEYQINGDAPANGSTAGNFVAGTNVPGGTWYENGGNESDGSALDVAGSLEACFCYRN